MANVNQTIKVVEAFVSAGNKVDEKEFPDFIKKVHQALVSIEDGETVSQTRDPVETPTTKPKATKKQSTKTSSKTKTEEPKTETAPKEEDNKDTKEIKPFLPIEDSYTGDSVTCLICGFTKKFIKGHLKDKHGLTPNKYRKKFDLPDDYPVTAPNYTETRRQSAIDNNLAEKMRVKREENKAKKASESQDISKSTEEKTPDLSVVEPTEKPKKVTNPFEHQLENPEEHLR